FLSMDDFEILLKKMRDARVLQIALGGGEPTLHPEFVEILKKLRVNGDIIPNYTTNGTLLTNEILEASKKYCGAVAVSYMENLYKTTLEAAKKFVDYGIQVNVHIVLLKSRLQNLNLIVEKYLKLGVNGIVLLLFKPMGRGKNQKNEVLMQQDKKLLLLKIFEILALNEKFDFKLNFDACSAPLLKDMPFLAESIDGCNGSRYSCYVDWNLKVKPCSFMQDQPGVDLKNNTFEKIWRSELFIEFRNKLMNYRYLGCKTCNFFKSCWGGCPLDPSIVVCDKKDGK
ncbi:MAG: radical SAM protein, partial [Candidatus Helarchaeota archaeon]